MQYYTLCHEKQIAQTFFPLACCLMVLPPVILPLTLALHEEIIKAGDSFPLPQKKWEHVTTCLKGTTISVLFILPIHPFFKYKQLYSASLC